MILTKKHAWLLFSVLSASLLALVPGHLNSRNAPHAATLQADGTEPPPPPFPWTHGNGANAQSSAITVGTQPVLSADGTEPPPPPFPWRNSAILSADGTEPPPSPFPWRPGSGPHAQSNSAQRILSADGTEPPPPPFPWKQNGPSQLA